MISSDFEQWSFAARSAGNRIAPVTADKASSSSEIPLTAVYFYRHIKTVFKLNRY